MKRDWKHIGKITLVVLTTIYIVGALMSFSYSSDSTMCKGYLVTVMDSATLRFVTPEMVEERLSNSKYRPLGIRSDVLKLDEIELFLESVPRIKKAECYMTPSGLLRVDVYQRDPLFRVLSSRSNYYVDCDGDVMHLSENFAAYVPIVTGNVSESFAKTALFDFAVFLKEDPFWNAMIEQIDVNERMELTLVPRVGDQIVVLGTLDDYEGKLTRLKKLYKNGFNKLGWRNYKTINLSFKDQVVCSKK